GASTTTREAQLLLPSFFFQAEDGIRAFHVTGVQTCALPISVRSTAIATLAEEDVTTARESGTPAWGASIDCSSSVPIRIIRRWCSSSGTQRALHVALVVTTAGIFPFVVQLLALCECQPHLRNPVAEVEFQRHQRKPLTLNSTDQLPNLLPVQQQLARSGWIVRKVAGLIVRRHVHVQQEHLSVSNDSEGIRDVRALGTKGLDLRALEHDSALESVKDRILVTCLSVLRNRDYLGLGFLAFGHHGGSRTWREPHAPSSLAELSHGKAEVLNCSQVRRTPALAATCARR